MSDKLLYKLQITVEEGAKIEDVENKLENLLFDLYDIDSVEEILVKDKTPPIDDDVQEIIDVIESINSSEIKFAMKTVTRLEDIQEE